MRFNLILVLLLSTVLSFAQQVGTISGKIKYKGAKKVVLLNHKYKPIGESKITNNKFSFQFKQDEISLGTIRVEAGKNSIVQSIIIEKGSIKANVNNMKLIEISGGKINDELFKYTTSKKYKKVIKEFMILTKGGDPKTVIGTKDEIRGVELFLKKGNMMTEHMNKVIFKKSTPRSKYYAAYLCEFQPDPDKIKNELDKYKKEMGENSELLKKTYTKYKQLKDFIKRRSGKMVGETYKPFIAQDLQGKKIDIAPIVKKNKYTLIQFWASWCGPCRKEIPLLKKLYKMYKSRGFEIISFSMDHNKLLWEDASKKEKLTWYNISDLKAFKSEITKNYPISGIPANVIVDKNGKIVGSNLIDHDLENMITKLMMK